MDRARDRATGANVEIREMQVGDGATGVIVNARDIVIQFGLTALPLSFQGRIKRLLRYYLGTAENPTVFGGRDAELRRLDAWLAAPTAPRNLLLTAPAGRGKTALLVRWLNTLCDSGWAVCFVPISIRYETNRPAIFYQALATRLASILGQSLPPAPGDPEAYYKEKVIEYLQQFEDSDQPPTLVIVDGLDEAFGWQVDNSIFPSEPPQNLRFVASARQLAGDRGSADWLRRLGWAPPRGSAADFEVPPLGRDGIRAVLASTGIAAPTTTEHTNLVENLYRLTERGDPLLVELYLQDLLGLAGGRPRLSPAELASLKPGYANYFRDWFDQQDKAWRDARLPVDRRALNAMFAILSCALGPLTLPAFERLIQAIVPDFNLTPDALVPIQRFVIGDGARTGFALAHPKLAEFLRVDHFRDSEIVTRAREAFIAWGSTVIHALGTGALQPGDVPEYCLLYHVQHLESAQPPARPELYRELLDEAWQKAWRAHPDGLRGFARDAEVVMARFDDAFRTPALLREPRIGLGGLIRCALCVSSVRSFGGAVPPNFMAELVRQGLVGPGQALALCRHKPEYERAATLEALAPLMSAEDLEEIFAQAGGLTDRKLRARTLSRLASSAPNDGWLAVWDDVLAIIRSTATDADDDDDVVWDVATTLAAFAAQRPRAERWKLYRRVLRMARECPNNDNRAALRTALKDRVRRSSSTVTPSSEPRAPLVLASPERPRMTMADARSRLSQVSAGPDCGRARELERMAAQLPDGVLAEALATIRAWEPWERGAALEHLAPCLGPDLVETVIRELLSGKEGLSYGVRSDLAVLLPRIALDARLLESACDQVLALMDWLEVGGAVALLRPYVATSDERFWNQLVDRVATWSDGYALQFMVSELVPHLGEVPLGRLLDRILTRADRRDSLMLCAPRLTLAQLRGAVAAVADNLGDVDVLLPALPVEERASTVASMYRNGVHIQDDLAFVVAFSSCATFLPDTEGNAAIDCALRSARNVRDPFERFASLLVVQGLPSLPPTEAESLAGEVRAARSAVIDEDCRLLADTFAALFEADERLAESTLAATLVALEKADDDVRTTIYSQLLWSLRLSDEQAMRILDWYEAQATTSEAFSASPRRELNVAFAATLSLVVGAFRDPVRGKAHQLIERSLTMIRDAHENSAEGELTSFVLRYFATFDGGDVEGYFDRFLELSTGDNTEHAQFLGAFLAFLTGERLLRGTQRYIRAMLQMTRAEMLNCLATGASDRFTPSQARYMRLPPAMRDRRIPGSWLSRVGGPGVGLEIFEALRDVKRWWP
jgi:hypothetical protein